VSGEPGEGDHLAIEASLNGLSPRKSRGATSRKAGDTLVAFLETHEHRLHLLRQNFTHVISALGIGDIRAGDEAAIRTRFLRLWNMLFDLGLKVFQTTITTHTASSDGWTTAEGQSIVNANFLPGGIRHRINDWIRSTPKPLTGHFDPSAFLETEPDSGIWITPDHSAITDDGPHLNALGRR